MTGTADELSIVCPAPPVPDGVTCSRGWRCLRVCGPLDFALVGILASLTAALRTAEVSVFAVSTYDTDYLLVRESDVERAVKALEDAGHAVRS